MEKDLSLEPRRTTWGAMAQTAAYTRAPISYVPETTLNEKYNFAEEVAIDPLLEFPFLEYYGYGRGSTYMKILPDNSGEATNYLHEPVDAALFYQMPFVLRDLDNDIPAAKRAELAGRCIMTMEDGTRKIAYFLRKLKRDTATVKGYKVIPETADTPEQKTELVGDPAYLNPVPKADDSGVDRTDGAYTRVQAILLSELDTWDISEMINAKQLLTGNSQLEVTEIGLFSAIPKDYTSDITGVNVTYKEAVRAQLNLVSPQRIIINSFAETGLSIQHDLGVDDPTSFNYIS